MKLFSKDQTSAKKQSNKPGEKQSNILKKLENEDVTKKRRWKRYSLNKTNSSIESIKYQKMFEDGICLVEEGVFTKTLKFTDINYQIAKEEFQEEIFNKWCSFYNSISSDSFLQLLLVNRTVDPETLQSTMSFKKTSENEQYHKFIDEFNDMLLAKSLEGNNSIVKDKYITYGVYADDLREARYKLARVESEIKDRLKSIGSTTHVLNGFERLEIINNFNSDWPLMLRYSDLFINNLTTRDYVAPSCFDFGENRSYYAYGGDKYGQVIILRELPLELGDDLLKKITDLTIPLAVSIHVEFIEHSRALEKVKKKLAFMSQQKADDLKRAAQKGYGTDLLPEELDVKTTDAEQLLEDLRDNEQNLFKVTILFWTCGSSVEELTANLYKIISTCRDAAFCKPDTLPYQQENALNSMYPLGVNRIRQGRHLTTAPLAVLMPFTTQEMFDTGGFYYGQNQISHNMIFINRKSLKVPSGWILGMPGSGKSFAGKREIINTLLSTNDDVLVIDPEREYSVLAEAFNGEKVEISPSSKTFINPFDVDLFYANGDNPLLFKSDFLYSFIEMLSGEITAERKSIIDRCIRRVYSGYLTSDGHEKLPTFRDFYNILIDQPEPEAKNLAVELEVYVEGTLNVFAHETNVNTDNRFVVYDVNKLGQHLKSVGMLVVLDQIWNRIVKNRQKGVRTWLYIDEIQLLFQNEYCAKYFDELWSRARKWGAIPTAITQNVSRLLSSVTAKMMLSNAEDFIMMLAQSSSDRNELEMLLNLSEEQLKYISGEVDPGSGLLYIGGACIPFKDEFSENTSLYKIMSTNPNEKEEQAVE